MRRRPPRRAAQCSTSSVTEPRCQRPPDGRRSRGRRADGWSYRLVAQSARGLLRSGCSSRLPAAKACPAVAPSAPGAAAQRRLERPHRHRRKASPHRRSDARSLSADLPERRPASAHRAATGSRAAEAADHDRGGAAARPTSGSSRNLRRKRRAVARQAARVSCKRASIAAAIASRTGPSSKRSTRAWRNPSTTSLCAPASSRPCERR